MEFHEKLQELRKQKGLTQEELAEFLFVSRTAVSKWESGRGYPNIDSLKAIAKFFSVTIDELLSGEEVLTIAEEDQKQKEAALRDRVFGLMDLSVAMFFFAPFFGQKADGNVQAVSLLLLTEIAPYLKAAYFATVIGTAAWGIAALALQNYRGALWVRNRSILSLLINAAAVLLFIISSQPYAAATVFIYLAVKAAMLVKKQ
ncbi:MAG: helix-turn-helix transcriptional regulator [Clostridia bacterium]|nr:helix-turn-helix transcriptional regulator [Clostridia bacterium]